MAIPKGWDKVFAGFTDADRRDLLRARLAGVSFVDAQVGRLPDTLDRLKVWENTAVIELRDAVSVRPRAAAALVENDDFASAADVEFLVDAPDASAHGVARDEH